MATREKRPALETDHQHVFAQIAVVFRAAFVLGAGGGFLLGCGTYRVFKPKQAYWEPDKQTVLWAGLERCRMMRVERIFDITRQTGARWISTPIQKLPEGEETLLPASPDDVLELDEVWSCVLKKAGARWVWTALCRRTRHIVARDRRPRALHHAFVYGRPSRMNTSTAICSVIFVRPLSRSSLQKPFMVLEKKLERQPIWNGGTPPCING